MSHFLENQRPAVAERHQQRSKANFLRRSSPQPPGRRKGVAPSSSRPAGDHAIARVRSLLWAPTLRGSTKESPPPGNEKFWPPHKRAIVRSLARRRVCVKTVWVIRRCTLRARFLYTQARPGACHIVGLSSCQTFACALDVALFWLLIVLLRERNSRGDG